MSGTVGITPVRPVGVVRALVAFTRSVVARSRSGLIHVREDGGFRGAAAVPAAVVITAVVSWLVISIASAVRPT